MSITERMRQKLIDALNPEHLEIINESHKHKGHAGDDGSGESHYQLKIASDHFEGLTRLERHRLVQKVIKLEIEQIHAISIKTKTPKEAGTL